MKQLQCVPHTEPVPLKYGKFATKVYVDKRIFLQCVENCGTLVVVTDDFTQLLNQSSGDLSIAHGLNLTELYSVATQDQDVFIEEYVPYHNNYRPCSMGDNTFGSVRVCVSVRLSVGALLFEPFDLSP